MVGYGEGVGVKSSPHDICAKQSEMEMYDLGSEQGIVQALTCTRYLQLGRAVLGDGDRKQSQVACGGLWI